MQSNSKDSNRRVKSKLDKAQAEIMAACGVPIAEIGRRLIRPPVTIRYWLIPAYAESIKKKAREKRAVNPEHARAINSRWRSNNQESARQRNRDWYRNNIAYCRQRNADYYAANIEAERARSRVHRQENKEEIAQKRKLWCQQNKQKLSADNKKRRDANIDYARQRVQEWRALNPDVNKECGRQSRARRRTARMSALVPITRQDTVARRNLFGGKCAYCGSSERIVMDHVLPIKHGGLDESANLVPACFSCNASKSAKPVEYWYRSQPFFNDKKWKRICKNAPHAASSQLSISILS